MEKYVEMHVNDFSLQDYGLLRDVCGRQALHLQSEKNKSQRLPGEDWKRRRSVYATGSGADVDSLAGEMFVLFFKCILSLLHCEGHTEMIPAVPTMNPIYMEYYFIRILNRFQLVWRYSFFIVNFLLFPVSV